MESLLTTRVAAKMLNIHINTLVRWAKQKKLKAIKLGRDWRFPAEEIQRIKEHGIV